MGEKGISAAAEHTRPATVFTLPTSGDHPPPRARSARARQIVRWFNLQPPHHAPPTDDPPALDSTALATAAQRPNTITLLTGPSGAGKSSLLRSMHQCNARWVDLPNVPIPNCPLIDCFGRAVPLDQVLADLSRVGLGEAWTYLRRPHQLSEGQRWRLRLALGLRTAARHTPAVLIADEFAALLDRVTAAVVAHALRRIVSASPLSAIVATSHDDLIPALRPDILVHCDFGRARITHPQEKGGES